MAKKKTRKELTPILVAFLMISILIPAASVKALGRKTVYVITKETYIQGKRKTITNYKYNKNGLLTEVREGKKASQKITYNKSQISQMITSDGKYKQTIKYTYKSQGRIKQILFKDGNGKYETAIVPTYNKKGIVTKYKDWGHGNITLYYSGTNIKKSKDGNGIITTYTYDKKKNIKKCVTKYDADTSDFSTFIYKYDGDRIKQRTAKSQSQFEGETGSVYKEIYKYTTKKLTVPASIVNQIKKQQRKLINHEYYKDPDLYDFGQIAFHV